MKKTLFFLIMLMFCNAYGQDEQQNHPRPPKLKIFLDCRSCDFEYLTQKLEYISFVRDQKGADVYVLVRQQVTGSGGQAYELELTGQDTYKNLFNRITFSTAPTNTPVETREQILDNLVTVLYTFWAQQGKEYRKSLENVKDSTTVVSTTLEETKDIWNKWVFNLGVNGSLSGEETSERSNLGVDFSAKQVTKKNKFFFRGSFNKDRSKFTFGNTEIVANNRRSTVNISNAFSIGKFWSLGVFAEAGASDYTNLSFYSSLKPAIEYSFFPYELSTKKQITLSYRIGGLHNTYKERTIFSKDKEFLWEQELNLNGSVQEKWGSFSGEISYKSFLNDTSLQAFNFTANTNVRLFKGFSFNLRGNYSITRNQINLAGGDLTLDELLLQQQQVASGYRFSVRVGLNYSFGSIYSAIINPRFGF